MIEIFETRRRRPDTRAWRLNNELTQADVAAAIGCTRWLVCRWECGHTEPSQRDLAALASHYNVTVEEIVNASPGTGRKRAPKSR